MIFYTDNLTSKNTLNKMVFAYNSKVAITNKIFD